MLKNWHAFTPIASEAMQKMGMKTAVIGSTIREVLGAEGDVFSVLVSRPALAGTLLNGKSVKVLRSSVDS